MSGVSGAAEFGSSIPYIGPILGTIFNSIGADQRRELYDQEYQNLNDINIPQFMRGNYTPEQFKAALYDTPEAAQYQTIGENQQTKSAQMAALQSLIDGAGRAGDATREAMSNQALMDASGLARQREGAIKAEAERRGQGGAGMDMVMRAQAAQMGANRAQQGTLQAAQQAALQKLAAQQAALSGASQVRGQDFNTAAANSDIVNRFNLFNTQARNAANQANVNMQNQGSMYNIGNNNAAQQWNMNRSDRNAQQTYENRMGKQGQRFRYTDTINGNERKDMEEANQRGAANRSYYESMMGGAGMGGGGGGGGGMGSMMSMFGGGK